MSSRKNYYNNETDRNQYDSLFSGWYNNDLNANSSLKFATNFYDQSNILDSSNLSLKSISLKSQSYSHFGNDSIRNQVQNTPNDINIGTISLTDMIKTNYCHKASKNSNDSIVSYEKITGVVNQQNVENFDFIDDGLQEVSNRKLQNRANAKRARERKKGQLQQMKELIQDLQSQNRALKSTLQNREKSQIKDSQKLEKKWRYCNRCKKQIFYNKESCQKEGSQVDQQQFVNFLKFKGKSKLEEQYLRIFGKRKNFTHTNQEQQMVIKEKQDPIIREKKCSRNTQQDMDVQFEQFDFLQKNKQKAAEQHAQNHRQRWIGKMWIALSVIMLVIGVHMNGLEGSGEKCIRLYQKQARQWVQDFQNQNVSTLKIKMKTKIGNTFIQNEKGGQKQVSKWKEKDKWYQKLQKFENYRENSQNRKHEGNFLGNYFSFESQQMYTRELLQQQQTEMQIDKDLLFSIHAELNDIGRYI